MSEGVIIVAMSDSHGNHRDVTVPECDILIHAGDISNFNKREHYLDFLAWFSEQPAIHKVFIGGNHDDELDGGIGPSLLSQHPDLIYLEGEMVELMGLKVWGSAVQPRVFNMAFCRPRADLIRTWDQMPSGMDVVVSHCPPYGLLDKNLNGEHVGCDVLKSALSSKPPLLNVFGHIHEAHGVTSQMVGGERCVFANCSVVNRKREVANKPWMFQIANGQVLIGTN